MNKARCEASRKKLVEKCEMLDRVKSAEKIHSAQYRPIAQLELVKRIQTGLRKNLIGSRPARAETGQARSEDGIRLHKEE